MLLALKEIGANFAAVLWLEAFSGSSPTAARSLPMPALRQRRGKSGGIRHQQGVSKAGEIQAANHDGPDCLAVDAYRRPRSALTRWFKERSPQGRKRAIVALARKLLVALWKFVTHGVLIEGA